MYQLSRFAANVRQAAVGLVWQRLLVNQAVQDYAFETRWLHIGFPTPLKGIGRSQLQLLPS
jgi:hypothetical protein